ncbi:hypothetical protein SacmaDRAFT_4760 [Saccharomonospora marina XMU15]|uniref:Uncharacterized protein n=1 Tax=Saccharomonospora marina XMU15 TaxID=882083 RepID=H5WZ00_9PSEU|nr:hypothetical protein [Saccharomonospora marina]EHR52934.1 hypothetical protein SacmaDRAFT_4760 [Saccharomonospora marina XMU15]
MNTAVEDKGNRTVGKPGLMRAGIILFAIGMVAVVAVFVLFAAGLQDLPVWLSAFAGVVTPLGLGLGLIALVREHRQR